MQQAIEKAREHRLANHFDSIIIDLPKYISLSRAITIDAGSSGEVDAPLIIRGREVGGSTITGAKKLPPEPANDHAFESGWPAKSSIRSKLRQVHLGELAASLSPAMAPRMYAKDASPGRLFVFEGDRRLMPARWPTDRYATDFTILQSDNANSVSLKLPEDAGDLKGQEYLWIAGYWGWNWWYEALKVTVTDNHVVGFPKPGSPVRDTSRFYLLNTTAGLTQDGYYYFASETSDIFYLPATDFDRGLNIPVADNLLRVVGAQNIRIELVAFEKSIGPAVVIENSQNVVLSNCYVGHVGSHGVVISGGERNRVESCVVDDTGLSGIVVSGGDRRTLTPGGHVVRDTRITRFGKEIPAYRPGIRLMGVGNRIEGCEIADAPHAGIIFEGNNHSIVGNILHSLVLDTTDAGAIYAGRDWTFRGNNIVSNYFYDITNHVDESVVVGVYLDDELSGTNVSANVFSNVDQAILVGGGRDNLITENLFLDSGKQNATIVVDLRGLSWQAAMREPGGSLIRGLERVPYLKSPYIDQYPELAAVLTDQPGAPLNNRIMHNLSQGNLIVTYDNPKTASSGIDIGNEKIELIKIKFPGSLYGIPLHAPALPKLTITQTLILGSIEKMKTLYFLNKQQK